MVDDITKLPDGYRAIVIAPEKGDTYLLVHIDSHDKAYDWVRNKRFEVHEMTGVFQVFDTEEVKTALAADLGPTTVTYPLNQLSDDELFSAGVPRPLIPAIRSIHSDDDLDILIGDTATASGGTARNAADLAALNAIMAEWTRTSANSLDATRD